MTAETQLPSLHHAPRSKLLHASRVQLLPSLLLLLLLRYRRMPIPLLPIRVLLLLRWVLLVLHVLPVLCVCSVLLLLMGVIARRSSSSSTTRW
jgi:hypothetical protein